MSARRALAAIWDFLVGDDWRLALAAVVAIGATALAGAWWLAPLIALAALYWSLRGANPLGSGGAITRCDTSVSDLPTPPSSSSPASPRDRSRDTR
jgi:hypothetical protein